MINYIDENEVPNSQLLKELEALNTSLIATYTVALSVFSNFLFSQSEKTRIMDQLNGIPGAENRPRLSHLPILSSKLLILTLIITIKANLDALNDLLALESSEENKRAIKVSKDALLATVLALISALIVYDALLNSPDTIILPFETFPI